MNLTADCRDNLAALRQNTAAPLASLERCVLLLDQFTGHDHSVVSTSYYTQVTGTIPGSNEQISDSNSDYFSKWTKDAATVELDDNVDICFMPNRVGTRSTQATQSCFLCAPEPDRIYAFNTQKPIGYTVNSKPYTVETHMLVFPTQHQPQQYHQEVFEECLQRVVDHAQQQVQRHEKPSLTGLFAGPVGGSQPHEHWHLLSKNTRIEYCVDNTQNLRQLTFNSNAQNGIFHVQSEALQDLNGQALQDPKRGELHYFDCLLVRGSKDYVAQQIPRILDHFAKPGTSENGDTPRALYNLAILPPDSSNRNRVVVFPRSPQAEHSKVVRSILWGENQSFSPSAHEMAGHWFMTKMPEDTQNNQEQVFNHKVTTALYKTAHDIRVPVSQLNLEPLFADQITLTQTPHLTQHPKSDCQGHEAVTWHGWPRAKSNSEQDPLLTSLVKPAGTQGVDIDHIVPVLSQQQVNDLYDVLQGTHEALTALDIPYFAGAGSLMGAIRHGGQMWNDDDGDLFVRDSDLNRFQEVAQVLATKGLRMQPGWPGFQISKIGSEIRADGTGVPFVDIGFMKPAVEKGVQLWRHIDSPEVRGEAFGPTFVHQVSAQTLDDNLTLTFQFGQSETFKGISLKVPHEREAIQYLDKAYGQNWFQVLKTRAHNHLEGTQAKSVTLSIQNHGHVAPKV